MLVRLCMLSCCVFVSMFVFVSVCVCVSLFVRLRWCFLVVRGPLSRTQPRGPRRLCGSVGGEVMGQEHAHRTSIPKDIRNLYQREQYDSRYLIDMIAALLVCIRSHLTPGNLGESSESRMPQDTARRGAERSAQLGNTFPFSFARAAQGFTIDRP